MSCNSMCVHQMEMLDNFPTEAGIGGDRILPFLPGVKLFGRSEVKKVADERKVRRNPCHIFSVLVLKR